MSSWFQNAVPDSFKDLTHKVQQALPKIDNEMMEKLTLTTPELTAERQRIDQEERRKEEMKDMLAGMLPWETRDPERDILVDECKEAILLLSSEKETFFGPYHMPGKKVKLKEEKSKEESSEDGSRGDVDDVDVDDDDDDDDEDLKPPSDSLEKLAKLEPLPVLLRDFDLNAHVGLINRLLKEDPKLVKMQSTLSGMCVYCVYCTVVLYVEFATRVKMSSLLLLFQSESTFFLTCTHDFKRQAVENGNTSFGRIISFIAPTLVMKLG